MASTDPKTLGDRDVLLGRLRRVYNIYRTAALNRKYYAHRLTITRRWNLVLECALAVGTSGALGAWAIWKTGAGGYAWTIIAGVAAVIAVVKPFLQLSKAIERYSKLFIGYSEVYYSLQQLVEEVQIVKDFTEEMAKSLRLGLERYKELALDDDPRPAEKLRRKYYEEVKREIPATSLWVPQ